jgi:hypothetical protein
MVKKLMLSTLIMTAVLQAKKPSTLLQKNCMECHIKQKIPSELIYRRYLLKHSTHSAIKEQLMLYFKAPSRKTSIMPKQFFLKFPEKEALDLNETVLEESIDAYLDYFDIRKKLILK